MRRRLIKIHWLISSQFGFDPLRFIRSLRGLLGFVVEWRRFRKGYSGKLTLMPCLHDRFEQGGATKSEYFWQDLVVARWIFEAAPKRHVDIGSRVDGFVAHVASFREIEVFDVRPNTASIPGIVFRQADLMRRDGLPAGGAGGYCDSLSCLHAIEHFGLGRYGDPIAPDGYKRGIENMAALISPGGTFYLSTPIGRQRVEFNANWVFDPRGLISFVESQGLQLEKAMGFKDGALREIKIDDRELTRLTSLHYSLGIFVFTKLAA